MSYCTVYAIVANGDVVEAGEARNNHGFAPLFWDIVGNRHGFGGFPWADKKRQAEFWTLWRSGKLSERDDIIMGATFDNVWVARENIPRLSRALREFYDEHCRDKVATMLDVAKILDEVAADATNRGACFNLCSANSNPWVVGFSEMDNVEKAAFLRTEFGRDPSVEEMCEFMEGNDYEGRPFNFDLDVGKKRVWGRDPLELFAR